MAIEKGRVGMTPTGQNVGSANRGRVREFMMTMAQRAVNRVGSMSSMPNSPSVRANTRIAGKAGEGNERLTNG